MFVLCLFVAVVFGVVSFVSCVVLRRCVLWCCCVCFGVCCDVLFCVCLRVVLLCVVMMM